MGTEIKVHDPYLDHWWELEKQETYPNPKYSKARFFHRQEKLNEIKIEKDMWKAMKGVEAVIFGVRHSQYMDLDPDKVVKAVGKPCAVIDCFCILDDEKIRRYFELGCEVKGMGRGHVSRIKDKVRNA